MKYLFLREKNSHYLNGYGLIKLKTFKHQIKCSSINEQDSDVT